MSNNTGLLSQYRGLRKEIYVLVFGRMVTSLGSMVYPMLTMIMSQKLHLSASQISLMMVASSVLMLPASLLGGRLADRYNKKNVIVCFDTISIVCFLFCGLVPLSFGTLILMLFAGICQSLEYPSYDALIADLTVTKDRERAYSLEYLGNNLGLVLSPTIAGLLFKNYLWLAFIISACSIGISTLLIFLKIKNITPEKDESAESVYQEKRSGESLWKILSENKVLVCFMFMSTLFYAVYGQYGYLMPLDMGAVHGEDGAVLYGTVSSLNCIVVVLFTPLITRLFKGWRDLHKMLAGEILVGIGYLMFMNLLGHVPVYYLCMLIFTWGEIFTTIAGSPYISSRIPASHRGRINGVSSVMGAVIQGIVYLLSGAVYDRAGSITAWSTILGFLAFAILLTIILIVIDKKRYPALYASREHA